MDFEWDEEKRATNIRRHGLDFADAVRVFDDALRLTEEDDRYDYGEIRYQTLGLLPPRLIVVLVAHTDRDGVTRIISARSATRGERRRYYVHR
jgi:uncharacterized DUF497 family protein